MHPFTLPAMMALFTLSSASPAPVYLATESCRVDNIDDAIIRTIECFKGIEVHAREFIASGLVCAPAIIARADLIKCQNELAILVDRATGSSNGIEFSSELLEELALSEAAALTLLEQRARPFAACNSANPASTTLAELVDLNQEFEAALLRGLRSESYRGKQFRGLFPELFALALTIIEAAETALDGVTQACQPMDNVGNNTMIVVTPSSNFFGILQCGPRNGMARPVRYSL